MSCDRLCGIFLALGLVGASLVIRDGILNFKKLGNTIEVRGLDERIVKSDRATWHIRYVISAEDIKSLYAGASETTTGIFDFLNSKGFAKEEIQKTAISIADRTTESYGSTNSFAKRFSARGTVIVTTDSVDKVTQASETTDALVEKGVVIEGSEIQYFFTDLNSIKPDMLKAASQSATAAAESLARDTGVKLGKIKQISQGLFSITSPYTEQDYLATSSVMKKIRVVTRAEYSIE
jgi:hypothetical protein